MLWSDYLAGRSHRVPAVKADLQAVIGRLDPSTVVAMWEYDATSDYAECEPFLSRGVTVFGATGEEDVRNLTTFARYAKAKHLPGMMHTTWTGYLGSVSAVYRWPRKLWPYIQAGLSFWEAEAPLISRQQPSRATAMYDRMVGDLYPEVRRIAPGPSRSAAASRSRLRASRSADRPVPSPSYGPAWRPTRRCATSAA